MKKYLLIIMALATVARAQIQYVDQSTLATNTANSTAWITIPGVCTNASYTVNNPSNQVIGDLPLVAWAKANTNWNYLEAEAGTNAAKIVNTSNGVVGWVNAQLYVSAMQSNIMLSSKQITLFTTNHFVFSGSNYVGRFANLYDWFMVTPVGYGDESGGPAPGTNQYEAVWCSYTGTNNWFLATNNFATSSNISVDIIGVPGGYGTLTIYGLDHPELLGHTNSADGQFWSKNGSPIASLSDLQSYVHVLAPPVQMAGGIQLDSYIATNGVEHVVFSAHGLIILDLTSTLSYVHIENFTWDGVATNADVFIYNTNLVSGFVIETCTNLNPPIQWLLVTNYTTTTNTGLIDFAVPASSSVPMQFWRARSGVTNAAAFAAPLSVGALFALAPRTITNATDTTWGSGGGQVCVDTNYVYVSVATNAWKRATLTPW